MATHPDIIFCANGNPEHMRIARKYNMLPGAQLPGTIYDIHKPLYFADQDFKNPRYLGYIKFLKKYKPVMASVLDIEEWRRFDEYLMRAEEISQHCQIVMLIPKINGAIRELERLFPDKKMNSKEIRLGYSVFTKYSGTTVPKNEFEGWPIHLLGGSPFKQLELSREMEVVSVDGNWAKKMAKRCQFFSLEPIEKAINKHWPTLYEFHGKRWEGNGNIEAFERSCEAIMAMWGNLKK